MQEARDTSRLCVRNATKDFQGETHGPAIETFIILRDSIHVHDAPSIKGQTHFEEGTISVSI
jgi:hypothetical protein